MPKKVVLFKAYYFWKLKSRMMKVCLAMILKNEEKIIQRSLGSAISAGIDYAIICDTGSTDCTVEVVTKQLSNANVPHTIYNTKWRGFAKNRTDYIKFAVQNPDIDISNTLLLVLDADEELVVVDSEWKQKLKHDVYLTNSQEKEGGIIKVYPHLFKPGPEVRYHGKIHEELYFPPSYTASRNPGVFIIDHEDGANRVEKYQRDLKILLEDPNVFRNTPGRREYYLADCYVALGEVDKSIEWFQKRVAIDHRPEEQWFSQFRLGMCYLLKKDGRRAYQELITAVSMRPHRLEPVHVLLVLLAENGMKEQVDLMKRKMSEVLEYPKNDHIGINPYLYPGKIKKGGELFLTRPA